MKLKRQEKRDYQIRAVRKLSPLLQKHGRVVAVAPTSSGKTYIAAAWLRSQRKKRVLWLAHRIELLRQAYDELRAAGIPESELGILSGTDKINTDARILIASVGMFRGGDVPDVDIVVVDEAHRSQAESYRAILDAVPKAWVLGLTATPWRLDGKGLGDVFAHMFVMATPVELIALKYIAQPITYGLPKEKARALVRGVKSGNGDYVQSQLASAMMKRRLVGDVVSECHRLARGLTTIVFAVNHLHAKSLYLRFRAARRKVEYMSEDVAGDPNERKAMLERLENGETQIVVNVDVLSEGFDCPPVKCIVLARPTRSLTRFLQQTGRAGRKYKGQRPIVIDHAGNCWRFGLPESEHEWSLEGRPVVGGDSEAPVKQCPECETMIPAGCVVCPECGEVQPAGEHVPAEDEKKLEKLAALETEKKLARQRLEQLARDKHAPLGWVDRVMASMFEAA